MEIENLNLYKINDHRVLSVSELQEFLAGTSQPHIRELLNTGKLPKTFVGKNRYGCTFKNVKKWIESNTEYNQIKIMQN